MVVVTQPGIADQIAATVSDRKCEALAVEVLLELRR
jgi:hypothetical protein